MRLGITECLDSNAVSTAKANRTVWIKARSPIESDVGNYEQVVKCWVFLRKKQILAGEGDKDCPRLLK